MTGWARRPALLVLLAAVIGVAAAVWYWWPSHAPSPAHFVGSASCKTCHPSQYSQWLESNHRHAMELSSAQTVLGDFNDANFRYFGRTTRFYKEGESFRVTTENQQGESQTFSVVYTLGYRPLQQYLVDLGDGRLQALPFAWDTRDRRDGGQRWFHLYPKEDVTAGNPLFWTRSLQNWNHMCGDCHTTGFTKNFADGKFESRWSETGNGCESCHGAGSAHIEARQSAQSDTRMEAAVGALRKQQGQIDQCGACHARRIRLSDAASHEGVETMLETWRPQLPQDGLYFVDGQIRDEVFEIGSFLQSRMAAEGVLCTDCHDPHTARLKAEGNALCTQCHAAETFDSTRHHFHMPGTPGAQCVQCHMPARTYMVVDPRRDHRFAIPRPDLSDSLDTPNPCVDCHTGRSNSWAAEAVRKEVTARKGSQNLPETWGTTAWQLIHEQTAATESLRRLFANPSIPSIAKATAFASIRTLTPESLAVVQSQLSAGDPLIRLGAFQVAAALPLKGTPFLIDRAQDPSRAVRLEVARLLVGADRNSLNAAQRDNVAAAIAEYREWLSRDTDRAEALTALAGLQVAEGDVVSARTSFEKALQRDDTALVTLLNFADFHRARGNDAEAETLLTRAVGLYPDSAEAHLALGLLRVRQKRTAEAIPEMARAAEIAPGNSNYAYVYAVALYSAGQIDAAFSALEKARARFPANTQIQNAIQAYCANQPQKGTLTKAHKAASICSELPRKG
jgi:predicted CXXCH cytochrome family protein